MVDLDSDRVTVAVAVLALVVVGAIVLRYVPNWLSITGRTLVLLVALVLLLALAAGNRTVDLLAPSVAAAAIAAGAYVPFALGLGLASSAVGAVIVLAGAAATLYMVDDGRLTLSHRTVRITFAVLVVGGIAFVGGDALTGGVTYEVDVHQQALTGGGQERVTVGVATASNPSPLREAAGFPSLDGCLYTGDGRSDLQVAYAGGSPYFPRSVPANGNATVEVEVVFRPVQLRALPSQMLVERAQTCPANRSSPAIVITGG